MGDRHSYRCVFLWPLLRLDVPVPTNVAAPRTASSPVCRVQVELNVDVPFARLVVLARDDGGAGQRVTGPHHVEEADVEAAHRRRTERVGDVGAEDPGREHSLREHRRKAGGAGDRVVVVERVEVAGRARVAHEVGDADGPTSCGGGCAALTAAPARARSRPPSFAKRATSVPAGSRNSVSST